jgi:type II secretory pathway predicted ATPase ExeA
MNYIMKYGLEYNPFVKNVEDTLYESADLKEATYRLNYLKDIKGFGVLTGDPGKGKTTIVRSWCKSLNRSLFKVVYIPLSTLTVMEFYRTLAMELGLEPCFQKNRNFKAIQDEISRLASDKRMTPVIILDEANYLKSATLNDLKILFNFEMDSKDKAIILLVGLPVLNNTLNLTIHEPLRQRIAISYNLDGFTKSETKDYVKNKLSKAGCLIEIFSESAYEAIANSSNGIAREIDRIVNRALMLGEKAKADIIDTEIIMKAYDDILLG